MGSAERKFRLKVRAPFGSDIVHVVAFRQAQDLQLLTGLRLDSPAALPLAVDQMLLQEYWVTLRRRGLQTSPAGGWGDAVVELHSASR